jgi:type I restriction enzyme S subunit
VSWAEFKLRDIAVLHYGKALPERDRKDGDIPVYGSGGITGFHNRALVKGPGIVVGRKGTVGAVYWETRPFFPIDTVYFVEPVNGCADNRFLYYLLRNLPLASMNSDAAVPGLNRENAYALRVKLPDLPTQERIASVLSAYDDLIENNRRRIGLLEQAARLLYREWFVHLHFPGNETAKIVDGLPEGWDRKKVGDFGDVVTGKTPSKKNEANFGGAIPFIKTPDMHGNTFVLSTEETLSEQGAKTQAKKTLPPRSILVSCIGTVGVVTMNATEAQTNQQINAVVPFQGCSPYVVFFSMKDLRPRLEGLGGGVTMANVSKGKFESIPVVIPSCSVQQEFEEVVEPMFSQILKLSQKNRSLSKARDLLLPRLMDGRLSVDV